MYYSYSNTVHIVSDYFCPMMVKIQGIVNDGKIAVI